jgi:uncharacterized protein
MDLNQRPSGFRLTSGRGFGRLPYQKKSGEFRHAAKTASRSVSLQRVLPTPVDCHFGLTLRVDSRNHALPSGRRAANCGFVQPAEDLCLSCGLCCDGALYDFVKLEPTDDAQKLKELGLPVRVSRGKVPVASFPQPCVALCKNRTCRVYADRPWQCRDFECGVLKDVKAGRITFITALRQVKKTRRRSDEVRLLLRELGDTDEHRALGERFHRTSERLEAGGIDEAVKAKYADLTLAVHHLKLQVSEKFYKQTPP